MFIRWRTQNEVSDRRLCVSHSTTLCCVTDTHKMLLTETSTAILHRYYTCNNRISREVQALSISSKCLSFGVLDFYRATARNSTQGITTRKSVRPSVRPSVKRVDKTKESSAHILIPHERPFILILWQEEWLVGATPSIAEIGNRSLEQKRRFSTDIRS